MFIIMKQLLFAIVIAFSSSLVASENHKSMAAKDVCADDYWKWCAQGEAPFDCFKKRGLFKKESLLSLDCKRAWSRPKPALSDKPTDEPARDKEPLAEQQIPQKLKAEPKKQPASVEAVRELPKKDVSQPDPDDFSDLEFQ